MKEYMKGRPLRRPFSKEEQQKVFDKVKEHAEKHLTTLPRINKIMVAGSLAKGTFGEYERKWKDSFYSDIDFILFVEDDFKPPKQWEFWFKSVDVTVYNNGYLDGKHLIQYMVLKRSSYENRKVQKDLEEFGLPVDLENTKKNFVVVYER